MCCQQLNSPQHHDGAVPALSSPSANVGPQLETNAQHTPRQDHDHANSKVNKLDTPDHHDGTIQVPTPSSPSANVGSQPASGTNAQHTPHQDNADSLSALVMASERACTINRTDLKRRLGNFFDDSLPETPTPKRFRRSLHNSPSCARAMCSDPLPSIPKRRRLQALNVCGGPCMQSLACMDDFQDAILDVTAALTKQAAVLVEILQALQAGRKDLKD
ncbi:hypothetical protein JVU11DRAFT_10070 [Chiua virens]|nr:hypothetical protein JVU11DRAFT_10070 [Chiua virens]